jgi:ATPase subunit of ABC transporter with duplicated ATPase domains
VICVSHDERFIDAVCREVWVCQGGNVNKFIPTQTPGGLGGVDEDGMEEIGGISGIAEYKKNLVKDLDV